MVWCHVGVGVVVPLVPSAGSQLPFQVPALPLCLCQCPSITYLPLWLSTPPSQRVEKTRAADLLILSFQMFVFSFDLCCSVVCCGVVSRTHAQMVRFHVSHLQGEVKE